jgi:purine nucleosidase
VRRYTSGITVTDFEVGSRTPNALVATSIDLPRFWDLVLAGFERAAAGIAVA